MSNEWSRPDGRASDEIRPVKITRGFTQYAEGSVLVEMGRTRVICTASVDNKVPAWMAEAGSGWVTAEYGMLPRATGTRVDREAAKGKQSGRTQEIQRLIGRSLRAVTDLQKLGPRTIRIDCDVIEADAGTRCASITGGYVALVDAVRWLQAKGLIAENPLLAQAAAISVGIFDGHPVCDLNYAEDHACGTDLNVVMTDQGGFIEIQGTAEGAPFSEAELNEMLSLARGGLQKLFTAQRFALQGDQ